MKCYTPELEIHYLDFSHASGKLSRRGLCFKPYGIHVIKPKKRTWRHCLFTDPLFSL